MILLELLFGFLFIGCFSFGGAYGAIPLIREVVLYFGWIDEEKLSYMIAVGESTPGPIMVNLATYIGSEKAGAAGAAIATAAVILPAFFVVIILMSVLKNCIKRGAVRAILAGLKSCAAGMILATGAYMIFVGFTGGVSAFSVDAAAAALAAGLSAVWFALRKTLKKSASPIMLICLAGVAGVLVYGWN